MADKCLIRATLCVFCVWKASSYLFGVFYCSVVMVSIGSLSLLTFLEARGYNWISSFHCDAFVISDTRACFICGGPISQLHFINRSQSCRLLAAKYCLKNYYPNLTCQWSACLRLWGTLLTCLISESYSIDAWILPFEVHFSWCKFW